MRRAAGRGDGHIARLQPPEFQDDASDQPVRFSLPDIGPSDVEAVLRVLASGWLTTGAECAALEAELAAKFGAPHIVTMSSCTAALETASAWLGLRSGQRFGVPSWTFVSSALAFMRAGATPVLLDVEPDTLNVSLSSVEAALEEGLDALTVVHFGGVPVDERIYAVCARAGVPVVEDAAHALGAHDSRGQIAGVGTLGACYSFYATKNLTSGEGGALATEDAELADFARSFRLHGMSKDAWTRYLPEGRASYDLTVPGIKANLPDLLAALARSQLARFDAMQARRRQIASRYRDNLTAIRVRPVPAELVDGGADHLMVVLLPEGVSRDDVVTSMTSVGIATSVHFRPLTGFDWFQRNAVVAAGGTPVSDRLADRALSLPLHPLLSDQSVDRVCGALADALA